MQRGSLTCWRPTCLPGSSGDSWLPISNEQTASHGAPGMSFRRRPALAESTEGCGRLIESQTARSCSLCWRSRPWRVVQQRQKHSDVVNERQQRVRRNANDDPARQYSRRSGEFLRRLCPHSWCSGRIQPHAVWKPRRLEQAGAGKRTFPRFRHHPNVWFQLNPGVAASPGEATWHIRFGVSSATTGQPQIAG